MGGELQLKRVAMKNLNHPITTLALAATLAGLAACGGGGDDTPAGSTAAVDPIDKYIGTFVGPCEVNASVTDAASGAKLGTRVTTVLTKISATKAAAQYKTGVYAVDDCSGTAAKTFDVAGNGSWMSIDGTKTVGTITAELVTWSAEARLPGITAGTSVTLNGIRYVPAYLAASTRKDTQSLVGADLYAGDASALDAQGYPTALQKAPAAKKQ